MSMTLDQLAREAMALPRDQRGELAERIVASLIARPDPEFDPLRTKDAIRRRDEARSETVKPVSGQEANKRIADLLAKTT